MRSIDIVTAHKVEITYPLASVGQRIMAFILDAIIIVVGFTVLSLLFEVIFANHLFEYFMYIVLFPFYMFYTLYSEVLLHGQTIGKKALGIRVVKLNGENLQFTDYMTRWIFRTVDIWLSMGSLAVIFISSNEKSQRIGDLLSNTSVIQTSSSRSFALSDVLNIMNLKDYKVVYPTAKTFTEQQMLLLKETLERYKMYNNEAHQKALNMLAQNMANQLGLEKTPLAKEKFLKTLLRDYIFMTR